MRFFWAVLEWIGTVTLRSLGWLADQLGQATLALARGIARWLRRTLFGTWRRAAATLFVGCLVAAHNWPRQAGPIAAQIMTIIVEVVGIAIMVSWLPALFGQPRRRRRRRD